MGSNHQQIDCLLNSLFRLKKNKENIKLHINHSFLGKSVGDQCILLKEVQLF